MDVSRNREETKLGSAVCERFSGNGGNLDHAQDMHEREIAEKTTAEELTSNLQQARRRFMITDILNSTALDSKKDSPLGATAGGLDMRLFFPQMAAAAVANYAAAEKAAEGGESEDENDEVGSEGKENDNDSGKKILFELKEILV